MIRIPASWHVNAWLEGIISRACAVRLAEDICDAMDLKIIATNIADIKPRGKCNGRIPFTLVCTLLESHLVIHTWPELGVVGLSVESCRAIDSNMGRAAASQNGMGIIEWRMSCRHGTKNGNKPSMK